VILVIGAVIALVLAAIDLVRSRGASLVCWAVVVLTIAILLDAWGIVAPR